MDDLPEVTTTHIDEDIMLFQEVANIWAGRAVQLPVDEICYVFTTAVEQVIH